MLSLKTWLMRRVSKFQDTNRVGRMLTIHESGLTGMDTIEIIVLISTPCLLLLQNHL